MFDTEAPVPTDPEDRDRRLMSRRLRGADDTVIDAWLAVEPRSWVLRHGANLYEAGLTAADATDLYRRLGSTTAGQLSRLLAQGRMADIDLRWVHLWAASGLLKPSYPLDKNGLPRRTSPDFVRWVTEARRYITVCEGDQHLAASAAAAGLSVEESVAMHERRELDLEALGTLAALREATRERPDD